MNGPEVLLASMKFNHQMTMAIASDCPAEMLAKKVAGSTINPAGAILVHAVTDEDLFIQGMMQGKPPIMKSGGWEAKTGISMPASPMQTPDWANGVTIDPATFLPYAQAVFAATEAYIGSLSDSDLDREVDGLQGKTRMGDFLAGIGVFHLGEHLGEIGAIKGIHGLKGLPF